MSNGTLTIKGAVLEESGRQTPYTESTPITISELELAQPGESEVRIKILAAGICHSDLSVVNNNRPRPLPMLLGHEASGVVEELGPGVTEFEVGQHVICTFLPRCEECKACQTDGRIPCERGSKANGEGTLLNGDRPLTRDGEVVNHHLGISGFATHVVADVRSLVPVGEDVPPEVAAVLGCAILTGGGALLNEIKPDEDTTLAVVGLGGVGAAAVLTAAALGLKEIVAIDVQDSKRELAKELGCTEAMTPDEAVESGRRFDAVIEAAGHPKALETAYQITGMGGMTVTVGLPAPNSISEIDPLVLTSEARTLKGSYLGSAVPKVDIPKYEELWREGKLHAEKLISSRIKLDEINEAMDKLENGLSLRQVIMFH